MIIVGAKGFAKEVLEVIHQNKELDNLVFYDDVTINLPDLLYDKFPILRNESQVKKYFETIGKEFTIGIGDPKLRWDLYLKFLKIGGVYTSTISKTSSIGNFGNKIEEGVNIMQKVVITNDVTIKRGVIINQLTSIGHDVFIDEFAEICPNVSISGNVSIGSKTFIGTGAIILPKLNIGSNVIIAAGSVVCNNIPDNVMVAGVPAVIKKHLV